jgi:hypothetical protein
MDTWNAECRRQDEDLESSLPAWTSTTGGCEGMRPIASTATGSTDTSEHHMVPMDRVYRAVFEAYKSEQDMYGR